MRNRFPILLAALVVFLCFSSSPGATVSPIMGNAKPIPKTLHVGSSGRRVSDLQWLLGGHTPSAYRSLTTFPYKVNGQFGKRTGLAVWHMKYRLGYPKEFLNREAGFQLFQILKGQQKRPIQWIAIAAKRQSVVSHPVYPSQVTLCQHKIVSLALSQVGVDEYPWGSNRGPGISYPTVRTKPSYQSVTGAYGAAWCMSFAQWTLYKAGIGPIADHSPGVFYVREWAYRRGLLRSKPEPGTVVLFLWSQGHTGIVVKVVQRGYYTVEGNYSNSVAHVYHSFSQSAIAFVYLPNCSA